MALKEALLMFVGIAILLALIGVSALAGGVSLGITGGIIAAVLHVIGFISMGTAQAVFLWFFSVGALLGALRGLLVTLAAGV